MHTDGPDRPALPDPFDSHRAVAAPHPAAARLHLLDASMFWGPTGGVRQVLMTKHRLLGAHGWRHTILAPGVAGSGFIDCGGLPLPRSGGYRLVVDRPRAERLIEAARPDIVEAADPYVLASATLRASARLGIPAVAFCHSNLPQVAARWLGGVDGTATRRGRWAADAARRYLVNLYRRFDLVLAPSLGLAEALRDGGLRNVRHQPLGVDCTVFSPAAADPQWRERLCQRHGLPRATSLLVYTGRFAPEKNLPLLTQAMARLGPGHALLAVGSGPAPPQGPQVIVLPTETDRGHLARLLASCDAYVHAGDQETFGLGVLEAMACGTPVVVNAAAGLGELARDAGTLVAGRDPQRWAEAIRTTLNEDLSRRTTAALARARGHDWPPIIEQLSQRYHWLLHGTARSPRDEPRAGGRPASRRDVSGLQPLRSTKATR